jgi:hypothetical protein
MTEDYTPPTREALVKAMYSDGLYIATCDSVKKDSLVA